LNFNGVARDLYDAGYFYGIARTRHEGDDGDEK
jgi:hypothetical protein